MSPYGKQEKRTETTASDLVRVRIQLFGAVQGVGFRPFVHGLASSLNLTGWVLNSGDGVTIEAEGSADRVECFLQCLETDRPAISMITSREVRYLEPEGYSVFEIRKSTASGSPVALIIPDLATCDECRADILDPKNRRYRYPFTNCTNCGPRFSIIRSLPYDRPNTSMSHFPMCPDCLAEYMDPSDRRFHAQPNACAVCGPQLSLWDPQGQVLAQQDEALAQTITALGNGQVVAVKGLGGFHLLARATDDTAVGELRRRKGRGNKPFALMVKDLKAAEQICTILPPERRILLAPEHPIVLLRARDPHKLSPSVAPENPYLGVMLPYTPLHILIMGGLDEPVVATSGNRSEEPICIDEMEALERLGGIADLFLVHDRPILRHVDDSIVRVAGGRELVLRRARGYAPLPVPVHEPLPEVLALGGQLKDTVALARGNMVFISQHIGDLDSRPAMDAFDSVVKDFQDLYRAEPTCVVSDQHPDYPSTIYAAGLGLRHLKTQHHVAHMLSCMAENELKPPAIGVTWDGTGYGPDGTVWGGEWFRLEANTIIRHAHFRTFPLPGGEQAVREPRRSAAGLLWELGVDPLKDNVLEKQFDWLETQAFPRMMTDNIHAPRTSSCGRIFDAVASLLDLCHRNRYEGEGAMTLEFTAMKSDDEGTYPVPVIGRVVDWGPMVEQILADRLAGTSDAVISRRFHRALANAIVRAIPGTEQTVCLSGGCFQNGLLLEMALEMLAAAGHRPFRHQRVPTGDGGISLGQAVGADRYTLVWNENP